MPDKPLALSKLPPAPLAEADYDAICAAVTASARGRWFLTEYAKRNRNSDTTQVLAAIERMGSVIADERAQHAGQETRIELLEMSRAIARTRAEVAEQRAPARAPETVVQSTPPDVAAAAERLRDIAWTMRACGVELSTSEQIERIAESILSSSLSDPSDHRAQKLGEVLLYLEHRIDRMLDSYAEPGGRDHGAVLEQPSLPPQAHDSASEHEPPTATAAAMPTAEAPTEMPAEASTGAAAAASIAMPAEAGTHTGPVPAADDAPAMPVPDLVSADPIAEAGPASEDHAPDAAPDATVEAAPVVVAAPEDSPTQAAAKTPAFAIIDFRIEPAALDVDPPIVTKSTTATRDDSADATAVAPDGDAEPAPEAVPTTGDRSLDAAFALADTPAAAAPESCREQDVPFAGLELDPLTVVYLDDLPAAPRSQTSTTPPESAETPIHPSTVEHALDQELAEQPFAGAHIFEPATAVMFVDAQAIEIPAPVSAEPVAPTLPEPVARQLAPPVEPSGPSPGSAAAPEDVPPADEAPPASEARAPAPILIPAAFEGLGLSPPVEPAPVSSEATAESVAPKPPATQAVVTSPVWSPVGGAHAPAPTVVEPLTVESAAALPVSPALTAMVAAPQQPSAEVATEQTASLAEPAGVTSQFDEDLQALSDVFEDAPAADGSAPAAPATSPSEPPETDRLSGAWETAMSSQPFAAARAAPVPSMWEHPPRARQDEEPADFLLEPLPANNAPIQAKPAADVHAEVESEPFAGPPAAAVAEPPAEASTPGATPAAEASPNPAPLPAIQAATAPARVAAPPMPRHVSDDPLAALNAMTDEERIAIFT